MLPLPDLAGLVTCPSCGRVTRVDLPSVEAAEPPEGPGTTSSTSGSAWPEPPVAAPVPGGSWAPPAPVAGAPSAPPPAASARPRGCRAGALGCGVVPGIIVLAMAIGVFSAVRSCDPDDVRERLDPTFDANGNLFPLSGSVTLLPEEGEASSTDLITTVQDSSSGTTVRRLARIRFEGEGSELLWQSEPLDDDAYRAEVASTPDTIFAAAEDSLLALDPDTGETRWRTTLQDEVTTGCITPCFGVVRGRLVVRTVDAYATAFGTRSAEPLWSRRLNSSSGGVQLVDGRILVVDDPEDPSQTTVVQQLDAANGKVIRTTTPRCAPSTATPWELEMATRDVISPIEGTDEVVSAFGFGDGCVVRWNPTTGEMRWARRLAGVSSFRSEEAVLGPQHLAVPTTSSQLVAVGLAEGTTRVLEGPSEVTVSPAAIVDDVLIGNSTTTRGTTRAGLVGWDLGTGERIWAVRAPGDAEPHSAGPYFSSDALFDGSPRSVLVTEEGADPTLFVFEGTERTFSAQPLDLQTGDLGTSVRRAFLSRYDSGTPSMTVEAVTGNRLLVSIDSLLQSIPISGRGEVTSFPSAD